MDDLKPVIVEIKQDVKDIKMAVDEIRLHTVKNTTALDYHIKRTDLNEQRIKSLEYWALALLASALVALLAKSL